MMDMGTVDPRDMVLSIMEPGEVAPHPFSTLLGVPTHPPDPPIPTPSTPMPHLTSEEVTVLKDLVARVSELEREVAEITPALHTARRWCHELKNEAADLYDIACIAPIYPRAHKVATPGGPPAYDNRRQERTARRHQPYPGRG